MSEEELEFQWEIELPRLPSKVVMANKKQANVVVNANRGKTVFFSEPNVRRNFELKKGKENVVNVVRKSDKIREMLRNKIVDKDEVVEETSTSHDSLTKEIQKIRSESASLPTIRKQDVFNSEITTSEQEIIQNRVALQQLQFRKYLEHENFKNWNRINEAYPYLQLNVQEVEDLVKEINNADTGDGESRSGGGGGGVYELELMLSGEEGIGFVKAYRKRKCVVQNPDPIQVDHSSIDYSQPKRRKFTQARKSNSQKLNNSYVRLRLDDALSQLPSSPLNGGSSPSPGPTSDNATVPNSKISKDIFEGWSAARIKAYSQISKNPNSYYYRFNAPGEAQRNGSWTEEEKKLFFKRLEECGADGQWGIFSMGIPGRVGYQCSNFYRSLIKSGKHVDPNYIIDAKGELRYLFGKSKGKEGVIRVHTKPHILGVGKLSKEEREQLEEQVLESGVHAAKQSIAANTVTSTAGKRKRRKVFGEEGDGDDEDDSGTFYCNVEVPVVEQEEEQCVLEGFIDPITLEQVVKPAISPYGHVMGYDTWVMCLQNGGKCPITKQDLKKRELVLLTWENIDEYRSKIVNQ
ncbi:hypothetical protein HK098_008055 [Nowakowskiella sp. JEL0407]|nr:hypothetical protein HK098_008055 [Nowakowskiella sp. JEL0407]